MILYFQFPAIASYIINVIQFVNHLELQLQYFFH